MRKKRATGAGMGFLNPKQSATLPCNEATPPKISQVAPIPNDQTFITCIFGGHTYSNLVVISLGYYEKVKRHTETEQFVEGLGKTT